MRVHHYDMQPKTTHQKAEKRKLRDILIKKPLRP